MEIGEAISLEPSQPMFYVIDGLTAATEALDNVELSQLWKEPLLQDVRKAAMLLRAEQDFVTATIVSSNDATLWSNLGWIQVLRGEDERAIHSFTHATMADPNDAVAWISIAMLDDRTGASGRVVEEYAHAIAVSPRILDSNLFHKVRAERPELAGAIISRADTLISTELQMAPSYLAYKARLDHYRGDTDRAHQEYLRVLSVLPNLSYARTNLALLDMSRGENKSAERELRQALFLDGTNRRGVDLLALAELRSGNTKASAQLYATAIALPLRSEHATRVSRIYHLVPWLPDDIVPRGLLMYMSADESMLRCEGRAPVQAMSLMSYSDDSVCNATTLK